VRILVQALTAAPGGSISVLTTLLRNWPSDDEIVCLAWRPEMVTILRETGHKVVAVDAASTPAALWRAATSYRRPLKRWRPDVVFAQQYILPGITAPQVVHHRNLLRFERIGSPSLKDRARDTGVLATIHHSALSLFNSFALRDAAIARWPQLATQRTAVVHNPIDVGSFARAVPRHDLRAIRILVPQSDMPHKRNDLAVEVLGKVLQDLHYRKDPRTVEMTFIGAGNYTLVRFAAERLGLMDRIHLPGYLGHPELAALYSETDVVLITSAKESFCNPVVEAHAAGIPIVTPPLPVFDEIAGPLSMTAEDCSASALSEKLLDALYPPPNHNQRRETGERFAQSFSGDAKAREIRELLKRAGNGSG
jgi:glycosyltransferase involved in cell wall biosynthesis